MPNSNNNKNRIPARAGKPPSNKTQQSAVTVTIEKPAMTEAAVSSLREIPTTFQAISNFFEQFSSANPFFLRKETFTRIEAVTGRPLIVYVTKIHKVPEGVPTIIDDSDLIGIGDLIDGIEGESVDFYLISNGGDATASERIVRLLREKFTDIRFIIPSNAFSAATLLCFSGDHIIMDSMSTLGPIDPQIQGVPVRTILRAFEELERRVNEDGPMVLATYARLIEKYDLHILEFCKSAEKLSEELAQNWLSRYMLKCPADDPNVTRIVDFFKSFDIQKSHGRSIDRRTARDLRLSVIYVEEIPNLGKLVRSLYNQYELLFDNSGFYKMYENSRGINWGRQAQSIPIQLPLVPPGLPTS